MRVWIFLCGFDTELRNNERAAIGFLFFLFLSSVGGRVIRMMMMIVLDNFLLAVSSRDISFQDAVRG